MLVVLATASMAMFAIAVLAPQAAPAIGVDAAHIGTFTAIAYLCAMFTGTLTGRFSLRHGAIRVCQVTLLAIATGMAAFATAWWPLVLLSAVLLGSAYGPQNPASAQILMSLPATRWRPLIFSVKQTGVPLGGALAGLVLPLLVEIRGWRYAAWLIALLALLVMLLIQPLRRRFDTVQPKQNLPTRFLAPLLQVFTYRALLGATWVAFAYAGCQVSVGAFFVIYLVNKLTMPLVQAGWVFAVLQVGGIVGRILWGALASRAVAPRKMLAILGLLTAACLVLTATIAAWPLAAILALGFVLGASSFGWNGVFLSEVARLAPSGRAAETTGAVQFVMFGGVVVVPPIFGLIIALSDSYAPAFLITAAVAVSAAVYLWISQPTAVT